MVYELITCSLTQTYSRFEKGQIAGEKYINGHHKYINNKITAI